MAPSLCLHAECGRLFERPTTFGKPPKYCSAECRRAAYKATRAALLRAAYVHHLDLDVWAVTVDRVPWATVSTETHAAVIARALNTYLSGLRRDALLGVAGAGEIPSKRGSL